MNHRLSVSFAAVFLIFSSYNGASAQDDLRIWRDFVGLLKAGKMTVDRVRPLTQLGDKYKPILLGFLDSVRTQASPADWDSRPEIIRVEDRIQYIVPWTANSQKVTYCFSLLSDGSQWYFQHLEAIFIRLDTVSNCPTSRFPDVPEEMKTWAREELYWSFVILNVYLPVAKDRGKEAALNMFRDGGGYFVGARTWVPFVPPEKAFVLYLCWEQANLRGNQVTLLKLQDNEAIVRLNTHFFALYFAAAHLKPVISLDDYKQVFETIWQDRASNAGWHLDMRYSPSYEVTFQLTRK
jgi:hypothetical protein